MKDKNKAKKLKSRVYMIIFFYIDVQEIISVDAFEFV